MPHFVMLQGALGAGKTLTASILAHRWARASGATIFANFDLRGAEPFKHWKTWFDVAESLGSVVIWDEAQIQYDRRLWSRHTIATELFLLSRKLRAVHVFCTPVGQNVDARILQLVEVLGNVRKRTGVGIAIDWYEYQDQRYGPLGRYLCTRYIPWKTVRRMFRAKLYDTFQTVYPFSMPNTERQQIEFLEKLQEVHQAALVRERKSIDTGVVEDGWYTVSDFEREREEREEDEEPEERGVLVP